MCVVSRTPHCPPTGEPCSFCPSWGLQDNTFEPDLADLHEAGQWPPAQPRPGTKVTIYGTVYQVARGCRLVPISEDELLKRAVLRLAAEHRAHRPGREGNISLHSLAVLLRRAGIPLRPDEMSSFL